MTVGVHNTLTPRCAANLRVLKVLVPLPEALPNIFIYSGYDVRTVIIDGEPWFVAADICEILDIADVTSALRGLDDDQKLLRLVSGAGQSRHMNTINESGLHSLAMDSRKAEAKAFKKWVTGTVLPEIRKTGSFNATEHKLPGSFAEALRMLATLWANWMLMKRGVF